LIASIINQLQALKGMVATPYPQRGCRYLFLFDKPLGADRQPTRQLTFSSRNFLTSISTNFDSLPFAAPFRQLAPPRNTFRGNAEGFMQLQNISYQRAVDYKVPAEQALALRQEGLSLREIKEKLAIDASLSTISRSIRRAEGTPCQGHL
jgi:hypothetical protein